jgi:nucleoid-associated protein YgaU
VISCGFVIMVGLFEAGGDVSEAGRTAVVRVHAGDTLWGIANRVDPDADPRAVVHRIVELNGLGAPSVEAGSHLVVPTGS